MSKTIYINFFDGINPTTVNKFIKFTVDAIAQHNPTEIYFFISSGGGDVNSGFTLYNFLISLQTKLTISMHNTGQIDSIANVIFMGGQKRYAAPNSAFLFHGVVLTFKESVGLGKLNEEVSRLISIETRMADTISKHTKLTTAELEALYKQGEN